MEADNLPVILEIGVLVAIVILGIRAVMRTSARPVAYGLTAVVVVYALLKISGFGILASILEQAFAFGGILAIILFREEVRGFLTRLGRRLEGLLPGDSAWTDREVGDIATEVASGITLLRGSGKGALVAIERSDSLADYEGSGIPIKGIASAALIEAIFRSTSPVHDGAILIQGGRIGAAGAILPLYDGENPFLRRRGTRHRAALGLATQTDAVVVVLSEETGEISLVAGPSVRTIKEEGLRRALLNTLKQSNASSLDAEKLPSSWRKIVSRLKLPG